MRVLNPAGGFAPRGGSRLTAPDNEQHETGSYGKNVELVLEEGQRIGTA